MKTLKEIKLKDGTIIPTGTKCRVTFNGNGSNLVRVYPDGFRDFQTRASHLTVWFSAFKTPSLSELEEWSNDGICESMLGNRVEPDGWDSEGSPSWLLALGMI